MVWLAFAEVWSSQGLAAGLREQCLDILAVHQEYLLMKPFSLKEPELMSSQSFFLTLTLKERQEVACMSWWNVSEKCYQETAKALSSGVDDTYVQSTLKCFEQDRCHLVPQT